MSVSRYPLSWPTGWVRTPRHERRRAAFAATGAPLGLGSTRRSTRPLTVSDALGRLDGELRRLGATEELLSTNVRVRLDGLPRSGEPEPEDPGAACYFALKGKPTTLACDRWTRVADNIAAIAQHIDALRRIDRYGVGTLAQAFAGYAALPPKGGETDWRIVLAFHPDRNGTLTLADVEARYRELARLHHPDLGGDPEQMARLNEARDAARRELNA